MICNTPNEAVASIKTRQDALDAIGSLYGLFDTSRGESFLIQLLKEHEHEVLNWIPDDAIIELAKLHMWEEWKVYPWK